MPARQAIPTIWLMTDERIDSQLEAAIARLPRGAGIVFRHHSTERGARRRRFDEIRRVAKARGLVLILAGSRRDAIGWRADGWHKRSPHREPRLIRTAPAHDRRELVAAQKAGTDVAFVSPVYPTRSHPGGRTLGRLRFGLMTSRPCCTIVALGGLTGRRYRALMPLGAAGWAAIDAWSV